MISSSESSSFFIIICLFFWVRGSINYLANWSSFDSPWLLPPFLSSLTRSAYLKVLSVFSQEADPGDTLPIMTVLQKPVNESLSTMVSLLPRNGVWFFPRSRARIHSLRASRDLLISAPSILVCLLWSMVSAPLSQPARSMKEILPNTLFFLLWCMREIWRMAWEREESALVLFWEVILTALPAAIVSMNSAGFQIVLTVRPTILTFCLPSSLAWSCSRLFSRSNSFPQYISQKETATVKSSYEEFLNAKISSAPRQQIPGQPLSKSPFIVQVLPLPVCPQAKQVTLAPKKAHWTIGRTQFSQSSVLETSSLKAESNLKVCSSMYLVKSTLSLHSKIVYLCSRTRTSWPSPTSTTSCSFLLISFLLRGRLRITTLILGCSQLSIRMQPLLIIYICMKSHKFIIMQQLSFCDSLGSQNANAFSCRHEITGEYSWMISRQKAAISLFLAASAFSRSASRQSKAKELPVMSSMPIFLIMLEQAVFLTSSLAAISWGSSSVQFCRRTLYFYWNFWRYLPMRRPTCRQSLPSYAHRQVRI